MTLPSGITGIKMIQATPNGGLPSYYVLATNKRVYALGNNYFGQLGDRTTITRTTWVNAKNPDNSLITDAAWISSNEHDLDYPGLAVLRMGGILYTAGSNDHYMLGRTENGDPNYLDLPNGITTNDVITHVEVGGNSTSIVKSGVPKFGFVGRARYGSMANGSNTDVTFSAFDFVQTPALSVCGSTLSLPQRVDNNIMVLSPVQNLLTLNTVENLAQIKIFNSVGQEVLIIDEPSNNVDLSILSNGIYFMVISSEDRIYRLKFVKG